MPETPDWNAPKSICECGHTGDGPNSQHINSKWEVGHGQCRACECKLFTWGGFLPEYMSFMDKWDCRNE